MKYKRQVIRSLRGPHNKHVVRGYDSNYQERIIVFMGHDDNGPSDDGWMSRERSMRDTSMIEHVAGPGTRTRTVTVMVNRTAKKNATCRACMIATSSKSWEAGSGGGYGGPRDTSRTA